MALDLHGKVAIVTGGASGLGKATATAFAAAGAQVVIGDLDDSGGQAVAKELGGLFQHTDVSDLESDQSLVEFAVRECGGVDIAFLNAGVSTGCGLGDDFDLARYRRAMGANLDGVVFGVHAVLPVMKAKGGGDIVATASLAGLTALPTDPVYTSNKHAVVGLTRSLGPTLIEQGIRMNAICPGFAESHIVDHARERLAQMGLTLIPAEVVADTVMRVLEGRNHGECWFIQPGREAAPFEFRSVPGPR